MKKVVMKWMVIKQMIIKQIMNEIMNWWVYSNYCNDDCVNLLDAQDDLKFHQDNE